MNVSKALGSWSGVCGLLLAALFLAGCETKPAGGAFAELPGITTPPAGASLAGTNAGTELDVLQVEDALIVSFSDLPTPVPSIEDRIKQDGTITLMLNQTFTAAGKTRSKLEKEIRDRYVPQYYKYMTVSVRRQEQTRFYFVGGEVKAPGRQVYLGPMTVLKAIQSCGDFTDFAKQRAVELTRSDGRKLKVNCKKAREDPSLDLDVYPGDKIHVPRSIW